jgi:hypothetical protein
MSTMTRNTFLKWLGGSVAGAGLLALTGCEEGRPTFDIDAPGPDAPAGCSATNAKTEFVENHPHAKHALVVPKEDVAAAVDKTYSIMGAAAHDHTITITAAQFMMLQSVAKIRFTSTTGTMSQDHTHEIDVSC